jgi:hypothetical protein
MGKFKSKGVLFDVMIKVKKYCLTYNISSVHDNLHVQVTFTPLFLALAGLSDCKVRGVVFIVKQVCRPY